MDWLNYHHLLYFWTVAREGSVTRAAERLMLAQPTVSGQIRKLETAIGEPLFERSGRELVLTETGHTVFAYAERIFSVGQELMNVLAGGAAATTMLRVGIADALPKLVACAILEPALRHTEDVRVICHQDKADRLLGELAQRGLDLVLADAPIGPTVSVRAFNHALGECGVTFFGVARLARRAKRDFPQSLAEVPVLLPTPNTMLRRSIDRWFEREHVHPRIVAEFEDSAMLKEFGQRGAGVFPVPSMVEKEVCRQYRVQVIRRLDDVRERLYAISLERTVRNPLVAELCEEARHILEDLDRT